MLIAAGLGCLFFTASTCQGGTIYACKKKLGGTIRIVGAATKCLATETKIAWPDTAEIAALRRQVSDLQVLLQHFSRNGDDISITGANLWVTSGSGATDGAVNGRGNIILGYNASRVPAGGTDVRTGSHNLIIGDRQNYSSYGGMVVGYANMIAAPFASVSGGVSNLASGARSSVSGGFNNTASGGGASVSGGSENTASGTKSSVSGGYLRSAVGEYDWWGGGLSQEQ
ncbi:MAG TPA: hypothetical protein VN317_00160 [Candidatus Methanoperedens sp.]|nr:hypothetical protein [Candidatus Methanoperedens sp.]